MKTSVIPKKGILRKEEAKIGVGVGTLGVGTALAFDGSESIGNLMRQDASTTNLSLHQFTYTLPQISSILAQNANAGYVDGLINGAGLALVSAGALLAVWNSFKLTTERITIKTEEGLKDAKGLLGRAFIVGGAVVASAISAGFYRAYNGVNNAIQNMQYYKTLNGGASWFAPMGNGLYAGGMYCPGPTTSACYSLSDYAQVVANTAYNNGVDTSLGIALLLGCTYILIRMLQGVDWKGEQDRNTDKS